MKKTIYLLITAALVFSSCAMIRESAKQKGCETGCKPAYDKMMEMCAKKSGNTKTACEKAATLANDKCQKECASVDNPDAAE